MEEMERAGNWLRFSVQYEVGNNALALWYMFQGALHQQRGGTVMVWEVNGHTPHISSSSWPMEVVMVVPELAEICENMLMSEGFGQAKLLAKKMTVLYKLAKAQLSKQYHYDFGLRALKSVLVMAGQLKRTNPELAEDITLIRALRDSNLPKFLYDDVPLFMGLIQDLFPGVEIPNVDYGTLQKAVERQLTLATLLPVPTYVAKIIQLFETMLVRHGVMVVGASVAEAYDELYYPERACRAQVPALQACGGDLGKLHPIAAGVARQTRDPQDDRKSTRLNSSHW